MNTNIYKLRIRKTELTCEKMAKSVYFDIPTECQEVFQWVAGQHLTVLFDINGEQVRRCYSISSSPYSVDGLRITVKRVKGGLVSNHINDNLDVGDIVDVMPPFGGFQLLPEQSKRRTHYFIAAGSGITPMYSMLHSVLLREPDSFVYLIYGNKSHKSIIFKQSLEALQKQYQNSMVLAHVFSSPSMFSSEQYWRKGIIDASAIEAMINDYPPYAQDVQYYVCGPGGMNAAVKQSLMALDAPVDRIHMESYGASSDSQEDIEGAIDAELNVVINHKKHKVSIEKGQTILSAVRQAGLNPPFSCESGVCGACKAHLSKGQVHMKAAMALTEAEVKSSAVLTCQSLPISAELDINYDK